MHVDIHSVKLADADRNIPVTGCLCPFTARKNVYLENRNHTLEIPCPHHFKLMSVLVPDAGTIILGLHSCIWT